MKSDSLFFRLFEESPNCFFRLIGRPENDAQRYSLDSIEYKATAVRLDGVFQPRQPNVDPAYIWEAQTYPSDKVYANLLTKIGRFLEHGNPKQDWVAVVIYANRSLEQNNLRPYRCLINFGPARADLPRRTAAGAARQLRPRRTGIDCR
jgi:predicted transposase YdaD